MTISKIKINIDPSKLSDEDLVLLEKATLKEIHNVREWLKSSEYLYDAILIEKTNRVQKK